MDEDVKKENEADREREGTEGGRVEQEQERSGDQDDQRTDRDKARRGGNMHIPIRPKFS